VFLFLHSAKRVFAECKKKTLGKEGSLPSVKKTLGKEGLYQVFFLTLDKEPSLPSVSFLPSVFSLATSARKKHSANL